MNGNKCWLWNAIPIGKIKVIARGLSNGLVEDQAYLKAVVRVRDMIDGLLAARLDALNKRFGVTSSAIDRYDYSKVFGGLRLIAKQYLFQPGGRIVGGNDHPDIFRRAHDIFS